MRAEIATRLVGDPRDPVLRTPSELLEQERATAMDAAERLRVFAHLGFFRVALLYVQPPLGEGKEPVTYLDLLFAPWHEGALAASKVPTEWVLGTLGPVWQQ